MTPSQALKQKIEAMAEAWIEQNDGCAESFSEGAQSLVPLVESLVEAMRVCADGDGEDFDRNRRQMLEDALTNYRKFIGG